MRQTETPLYRFWRRAPADLKWVALALPIMLGVVLYSTAPGHGARPPGTTAVPARAAVRPASPPALAVVKASLPPPAPAGTAAKAAHPVPPSSASFWQGVSDRAALALSDDFRSGLGDWEGRGDWARTWSYDASGTIRLGQLSLYKPSLQLADYRLNFLAQIDRHSIGWAVRASDAGSRYEYQLVTDGHRVRPRLELVRSVVLRGQTVASQRLPLPPGFRADGLVLVEVVVNGGEIRTMLQGELIDGFRDSRLSRGGVGFFAPRGSAARLRSVTLSHQQDLMGRLCALLASPVGQQPPLDK